MSDHSELKRLLEYALEYRNNIETPPDVEKFCRLTELSRPENILNMIADIDSLRADLQGELSAAKEDAHRQRADQIAYRAAVYRLKREAPGEVVGGARLQRLFLISNDSAQILLSAMKERGDLVEIKEKPWGGMVPSTNSEILGEQP